MRGAQPLQVRPEIQLPQELFLSGVVFARDEAASAFALCEGCPELEYTCLLGKEELHSSSFGALSRRRLAQGCLYRGTLAITPRGAQLVCFAEAQLATALTRGCRRAPQARAGVSQHRRRDCYAAGAGSRAIFC